MFSPAFDVASSLPRPRIGTRRGGPVLLREVMPAALDQLLGGQAPRADSPGDDGPARPGRPPFPRAA